MDQTRFGPPQRFGAYNQMPPRALLPRENAASYRFPYPPVGLQHGPLPPEDDEVRTMIDRLADYISKNGPDKEEEMRRGHHGNPRFEFLFGGRHSEYYKFRLMLATRNLNGPPLPFKKPPLLQRAGSGWIDPPIFDVQTAKNQIEKLRQQITDSHNNLLAQYSSINHNREEKIAAAVKQAEKDRIFAVLQKEKINIEPLSVLLQKLDDGCGREVVQEAKKWIIQYCDSDNDQVSDVILSYMLSRIKDDDASDSFKLFVLYVVNEWTLSVHRQKNRLENVKQSISRFIAQLYAFASIGKDEQPSLLIEKLEKLTTIWEKSKTFDDSTLQQLRNPAQIKANYKLTLYTETQRVDRELTARTLADYNMYEQQHMEFEKHALAQIDSLEKQIKQRKWDGETINSHGEANSVDPNPRCSGDSYNAVGVPNDVANPRRSRFDQAIIPPVINGDDFRQFEKPIWNGMPEANGGFFNPAVPPIAPRAPMPLKDVLLPHTQNPPGRLFNGSADCGVPPTKKAKHWSEHTVGDMLTAIPDDAFTYEAINPDDVDVYAPGPCTPELSATLERFYDTHIDPNNPRDTDGWEQLGLHDYYSMKEGHRQQLLQRLSEAGKVLEDVITNRFVPEVDDES